MAARYMVIISTLDSGWLEGKANLSERQVPHLRRRSNKIDTI